MYLKFAENQGSRSIISRSTSNNTTTNNNNNINNNKILVCHFKKVFSMSANCGHNENYGYN